MARPRPIDHRQEMREPHHDRTEDWQALRSDLLDLLDEMDSRERDFSRSGAHDRRPPARPPVAANSPDEYDPRAGDRHRRALNNVSQTLERFAGRGDDASVGVSNAIAQIRDHHSGVPKRRADRVEDFRGSVRQMSDRLEQIGRNLRVDESRNVDSQQITNQLAQLTHTVELLAGAVGESGQVKRLEAQIAGLAEAVAQPPDIGQTELNQRLDRLAATVEQISDSQYQLADRPVTMIEELSDAQSRGFDAVEAGVRGIYDRLDALEQNIGVNPADIERLSADMAELVRMVQSGTAERSLLSKIDALNARMNGIEDGQNFAGSLGGDVETLRDAVRDAVEPRFTEMKGIIDTLERKFKAGNGGTGDLEGHISQLIARLDQTGTQLSEMSKLRAASSDGTPDLAALADIVAERTSKALSQTAKTAFADVESLDERVHESILQVDKRLAQLEATLKENAGPNRKVAFVAAKPTASKKAEPAAAAEVAPPEGALTPSASTELPSPAKPAPQPNGSPAQKLPPLPTQQAPVQASVDADQRAAAPVSDPAPTAKPHTDSSDAMRINPSEDRPLVDQGFGEAQNPPSRSAAVEARVSPDDFVAKRDPIPRAAPEGFDPSNVEPPRRPKSSFSDDTGSTFEPEADESSAAPRETTNRNTFIEAARRAAQRQDADDDGTGGSMLGRFLGRLKPKNEFEDEGDDIADTEMADVDAPASGIRARLAGIGRKSRSAAPEIEQDGQHYEMEQPYHPEDADEDTTRGSFLSRHRRPLMLAGLVILVSLLALNLMLRRAGTTPPPAATTSQTEQVPESAQPSGMSQPLLDPQPTGSIDPFVRQIPGTGMPDQLMSAPLKADPAEMMAPADTMTTSALGPTIENSAKFAAPDADAPLKFELPDESIGPQPLREAAAKGDPRAQFEIAAIISEGRVVPKDMPEAAKWYERAAAQGFAPAAYRIGNIYEHGQGVGKDIEQAKIWYERAAQAGNRMSMHNLAALYASGALGKQQFNKAAEWFERAAGMGLTDSQFNLGMLHARGLGVPQDMAVSYKWFSLAALRGDDGAAKARDDVARSLDAETINRLRAEVASWRPLDIDLRANFAPIGTWAKDFNPGNSISDKNVIMEVQGALNRLGFDVGTPDGLMGPRTREAIAAFERDTGMSESGSVNPRLLAVLGSQPV